MAIFIWIYRACSEFFVHAIDTPNSKKRRDLCSIADQPYQANISENFGFSVDRLVELRPGNKDVSVDRDWPNAK